MEKRSVRTFNQYIYIYQNIFSDIRIGPVVLRPAESELWYDGRRSPECSELADTTNLYTGKWPIFAHFSIFFLVNIQN